MKLKRVVRRGAATLAAIALVSVLAYTHLGVAGAANPDFDAE
jgi:hypothetical protein